MRDAVAATVMVLVAAGCGQATAAGTATATAAAAASATATEEAESSAAPQGATRYRVVVSFGSECCGTDRKALEALERVVARYPRAALGHTRGHWGKEGELDECFSLEGLSDAERARFVGEVRASVSGKLTSVGENAPCRNDR